MVAHQYALIGVEGNHDQAFVEKVLRKLLGFKKISSELENLDDFWRKFIPKYPPKSGKLQVRLNMPSILQREVLSVGIYVGEGSNLANKLSATLFNIDTTHLVAFGIIADADKKPPQQIAKEYQATFLSNFQDFPQQPGVVQGDIPRLGIYILPDNTNQGVLETLVCSCGDVVYPTYMKRARSYLQQYTPEEIQKIKWKPFDQEKAAIATVASVLKPGKTNTATIADDKWICPETFEQVPELAQFVEFLRNLLINDEANQ